MKSQVLDQAEGEVAKESEEAGGFRQKGERKGAITKHRVATVQKFSSHLSPQSSACLPTYISFDLLGSGLWL